MQVFTNICEVEGAGVSTFPHLEGRGKSCRLGTGDCTMAWEWWADLSWHCQQGRELGGMCCLISPVFPGLFVGKEGPMIHSGAVVGAGLPQVSARLGCWSVTPLLC